MTEGTPGTGHINIETCGAGDRRVVALHCSLGRAAGWRGLADLLPGTRVTAPDWPGHGRSAPWTGPGPMREAAVAIALDLLGDEPADLVGHSYGALIALDAATRRPGRVRSLTLIEPIFLAVAGLDDRPRLDAYLAGMQPHFEALAEGRHEAAARLFMDIWGGGVRWDALPEAQRAALARQIPVVDACKPGDETSPAEQAVLAGLGGLSMPVLILRGGQSLEVLGVVAAGLAARLPRARLVTLPGAGHMLPLTHTAAVAEALAGFWQETLAEA